MFLITPVANVIQDLAVFTWDFGLALTNLVAPKRKVGHVTPEGQAGAGGSGLRILPRDGKNITFKEMNAKIRATYNFAPSFCFFVPNFAAKMLNKKYSTGTFDLADLDLHNGIEHDGSLTREDSALVPDQSVPHLPFVHELLGSSTGKDKDGNPLLTSKDLSEYSAKRRVDARATNPDFSLSLFHKMFGSSNSSTLLTIFGGRVPDLESILIQERIPEGWESRVRQPMGLTVAAFNFTVLGVERGISEKRYRAKVAAQAAEAEVEAEGERGSVSKVGDEI